MSKRDAIVDVFIFYSTSIEIVADAVLSHPSRVLSVQCWTATFQLPAAVSLCWDQAKLLFPTHWRQKHKRNSPPHLYRLSNDLMHWCIYSIPQLPTPSVVLQVYCVLHFCSMSCPVSHSFSTELSSRLMLGVTGLTICS